MAKKSSDPFLYSSSTYWPEVNSSTGWPRILGFVQPLPQLTHRAEVPFWTGKSRKPEDMVPAQCSCHKSGVSLQEKHLTVNVPSSSSGWVTNCDQGEGQYKKNVLRSETLFKRPNIIWYKSVENFKPKSDLRHNGYFGGVQLRAAN